MPAPKKKKPARRTVKKPPDDRSSAAKRGEPVPKPVVDALNTIRDHGDIVTAPAGTSENDIVSQLTGVDKVPTYEELGRAKAPPFDPHEGREMPPGREFGDKPEAMVTTMVFMGIDHGGDFEDQVNSLITEAEKLGLLYLHASIGKMNLDSHLDTIAEIADEVAPTTIDTDDEPEMDGNDDDYGEPI